jgi:hypothetical protein
MTSLTHEQATSEINRTFFAEWSAGAAAIAGYVPEVRWQNVEKGPIPDASKFWARVTVNEGGEFQATLATNCGTVGARRFRSYGLVAVQIFCPKSLSTAAETGKKLAQLAKNAFRKAPESNLAFSNCYTKSLPPEAEYYRFNVIAEYEYDEIT